MFFSLNVANDTDLFHEHDHLYESGYKFVSVTKTDSGYLEVVLDMRGTYLHDWIKDHPLLKGIAPKQYSVNQSVWRFGAYRFKLFTDKKDRDREVAVSKQLEKDDLSFVVVDTCDFPDTQGYGMLANHVEGETIDEDNEEQVAKWDKLLGELSVRFTNLDDIRDNFLLCPDGKIRCIDLETWIDVVSE